MLPLLSWQTARSFRSRLQDEIGTVATTIRHNVFSKASGGSTGGNARPNLLVGHWPLSGSGANDHYEIYGNFFFENPTESLLQAEGNVAIYQNLFVNRSGVGIRIQPHNDVPKMIRIFNNTIVTTGQGISVTGGDPAFTQEVIGNGVFASPAISGGTQADNITDTYAAAVSYLVNPMAAPGGGLDLYPLVGRMKGSTIPSSSIDTFSSWNLDFNGDLHDGTFRGAYAGEGTNPGWLPDLTRKPYPTKGDDFLVGQGLGAQNPNRVRVYTAAGSPTTVDFLAFSAGAWGVNVASAALDSVALDEIAAAPGPGAVFGPQLRGFSNTGTPLSKVNFYAYSTLRFGANVAAGDIDADGFDELLSGAGPGVVFGPHVRGFNVDGKAVSSIAKVNFFAYKTLKFGVGAEGGDLEQDGFEEIVTGPGPGFIFSPQVRGFNFDGATLKAIARINFNAFTTPNYGVLAASGDVEGDGFSEIVATPGPGPSLPAGFLGFNDDGTGIAAISGYDVTPFASLYGGRIGLGDMDGSSAMSDDLLAGAGRDPSATSTVESYVYSAGSLTRRSTSFTPFPAGYGVNPSSGDLR